MDAEAAGLMFGLGRARAATLQIYEVQDALDSLDSAFSYYAESGDVGRAVAVAASVPRISVGERVGAKTLLEKALALIPPESREAGSLLSLYGQVIGLQEGNYEDAKAALERAIAIALREGDVGLEVRTLANFANVETFHENMAEALEISLKAIELARGVEEPRAEVSALWAAAMTSWRTGDLEGTRLHGTAALLVAEKLRDRFWLGGSLWPNEHVAYAEGNWTTAREFSERGLVVADHDSRLLCTRVQLEYGLGEFDQGEVYLERLLDSVRLSPPGPNFAHAATAMVIPIVGRIAGDESRYDIAQRSAEAILLSGSATPVFATCARIGMGLIVVSRGDVSEAHQQYQALVSLVDAGSVITYISTDRILGLLAHTMGDSDLATRHFEEGVAFCRKAGYRPELAWTCLDYAEKLLVGAHGRAPLRDANAKAASLLDEARAIATELGMGPLMERVLAIKEQTDSVPQAPPVYPDGRTRREVEVLDLVAAGKTDREIAEALIIGVRTVTTHVSNILNKVGAANRTEAATYAVLRGLVEPLPGSEG